VSQKHVLFGWQPLRFSPRLLRVCRQALAERRLSHRFLRERDRAGDDCLSGEISWPPVVLTGVALVVIPALADAGVSFW